MEIVIVICLLIVIVLLLKDKIVIHKRSEQKFTQQKDNQPDIMGNPKPVKSLTVPNTANESQIKETEINPDNLEIEYDENENVSIRIPKEELDEVFSNMHDLEEEEEEWNSYGISSGDNGFAQGVTFDELSTVGTLLQKENLEHTQNEIAVAIVQRLQGTELFELLQNSIEGASIKIARLLDNKLYANADPGSPNMSNNDLKGFDISEFV